jgi:ketosteroid isomerase-like protein
MRGRGRLVIGANSSGRILARIVSSVPATVADSVVRERVSAYYESYSSRDIPAREALFAPDCHFEDPAGRVVATDRESLHAFFTQALPESWSITFALERVAVVGNEALATSILRLQADERTPVSVTVNSHFAFSNSGLIQSIRTFFDEAAMTEETPD